MLAGATDELAKVTAELSIALSSKLLTCQNPNIYSSFPQRASDEASETVDSASVGLPYIWDFPEMSGYSVLEFVPENNIKNALMAGILTMSNSRLVLKQSASAVNTKTSTFDFFRCFSLTNTNVHSSFPRSASDQASETLDSDCGEICLHSTLDSCAGQAVEPNFN